MNSTPPDSRSDTQSGDEQASSKTIHKYNNRFVIQPGAHHLRNANIDLGDDIGLNLINFNGDPAVEIHADTNQGVQRSIWDPKESGDTAPTITLPKKLVILGDLEDEQIKFHSDEGQILGIIDHQQTLSSPVEVYDVSKTELKNTSRGYRFGIPNSHVENTNMGEKHWFWFDTFGDGFLLIYDKEEQQAPDHAHPIDAEIRSKHSSPYRTRIPKPIADMLDLDGTTIELGHDTIRVLGKVEP